MKDDASYLHYFILIDNKLDKIQITLPIDSNLNVKLLYSGNFRNEIDIFFI